MKVFTKKAKPVKRGEKKKDELFDISKIKDVSLDGKPKKKKSNYQYHRERAERAKNGEDKKSYSKWGGKSSDKKDFKWSNSKCDDNKGKRSQGSSYKGNAKENKSYSRKSSSGKYGR